MACLLRHRSLLHGEIRLIEYDTSQSTDVLACRTKIKSLSRATIPAEPFSALSYVWGHPAVQKPLMLDNVVVHITTNLHDALSTVWSRYPCSQLWVDALCILQDNISERNNQVLMMGDIFGSAENVFVWLGPGLKGGGGLWTLLQRWIQTQNFDNDEYEEDLEDLLKGQDNALAMDLDDLIHRPWFTRAWTYQEIRLAPDAIAFCGNLSMPWNLFVLSLNAFNRLGAFLNTFSLLRTFLKDQSGLFSDAILWRAAYLNKPLKEPLFELMKATWSRDATDPRDKIYAFISPRLTSTPFQELRPDYGLDVRQTFIKFARTYINRAGDLAFLMFARGTDGASDWAEARSNQRQMRSKVVFAGWVRLPNLLREPPEPPQQGLTRPSTESCNLPTWVCDWRMTGMQLEVVAPKADNEFVFDFRGTENCLAQSVQDFSQKLSLRVCVIARVCGASKALGSFLRLPDCALSKLQPSHTPDQESVVKGVLLLENIVKLSRGKSSIPCSFMAHLLLNVLLHDLAVCECHPCKPTDHEPQGDDEAALQNPSLLQASCHSTRYPRSQPHTGDWLCLADGLRWPVLLRPFTKPCTRGSVRSEIGFNFVSVCYLSASPDDVGKWLKSPCVYGEVNIY